MATDIKKTDYLSYVDELLPQQFENASNTKAILEIFLNQDQEFQDELEKLFDVGLDINTATGYQLDIIGKLSGVDRTDFEDEIYRQDIKNRRISDNYSGTRDELLLAAKDLTDSTDTNLFSHYPAFICMQVNGDIMYNYNVLRLDGAAAAGVNLHSVIHTPDDVGFIPCEIDNAYDNYDSVNGVFTEVTQGDPLYVSVFPEIDDAYDETFVGAGETFMQAGEPLAIASSIAISIPTNKGIYPELYIQGPERLYQLTYVVNDNEVDVYTGATTTITKVSVTPPQ